MSDSLWPHGLYPAGLLCPWSSPGKNTWVGFCTLLQEIFPTQGSNPGLLHYRQILYCLSHQENPYIFLNFLYNYFKSLYNNPFVLLSENNFFFLKSTLRLYLLTPLSFFFFLYLCVLGFHLSWSNESAEKYFLFLKWNSRFSFIDVIFPLTFLWISLPGRIKVCWLSGSSLEAEDWKSQNSLKSHCLYHSQYRSPGRGVWSAWLCMDEGLQGANSRQSF